MLSLTVAGGTVEPVAQASDAPDSESTEPEVEKPAKIRVRGYGLLGNRRLLQNLRVLRPEGGGAPYLDANTVEDAALLLLAAVREDGYLRPRVDVELLLPDGSISRLPCDADAETRFEVPPELKATEALFRVRRGVLYTFQELRFEGLSAMSETAARSFFVVEDLVIRQRQTRVFSESRLRRGLSHMREELLRLGYADAEVASRDVHLDHETGRVDLVIVVQEGPRHIVRTTRVMVWDSDTNLVAVTKTKDLREPYSRLWEQHWVRQLKDPLYTGGYADAQVTVEAEPWLGGMLEREWAVTARIEQGPAIRVGAIMTEGLKRTRERVVRRRTQFARGDPLDPRRIEDSRFQMLRLGVFDRVDVAYGETDDDGEREVVFSVKESKPISLSVLAGYGSYELLRGGLEFEQVDLFGLAHRHRLLAVQSFKGTKLEYGYTIPQAFDAQGDLSATGYYRRREETTFVRRDYGGSLGYNRYLPTLLTDVGLRYTFERLQTEDPNFNPTYGLQQANVSSIGLTLDHNRSDNPLYPMRGYRTYATAEYANDYLGGGARYGRFELGGSFHLPVSRTLVLHLGASHSVVVTPGDVADDLPFNRRFFLGGANTMRGFTQGEAASRDAAGKLVGDESTIMGHVELEQRLTQQWSVVGFVDAAGLARDVADYPAKDLLVSVGGGVRFRSPVGPLRLEYGHNIERRPGDDAGTLHFSIGYPF
jgi:outer membrane protein assembly complex protein YaeT